MKFLFCFCFLSIATFGQAEFEVTENLILKEQFLSAEKLMTEYVKKHPHNLKGIELLGDAYGHQKKWDNAIEQYKKLVDLSPATANYHYKYGGAMGMKALSINKIKALGIIGDVKQAFLTAAQLDPNHLDTRWALVELYMKLPGIIGGSKNKALDYAKELQRLSKVDGFLAKGFIYEHDKDYPLAEKYYQLAIEEGGSLVCYDKLTKLYQLQKQPVRAIANMEVALSNHNHNNLNYQIGKTAATNQIELDKGVQHLKAYLKHYAITDEVAPAWANFYLGKIYGFQNDKAEGLKYTNLALADDPQNEQFLKLKQALLQLP